MVAPGAGVLGAHPPDPASMVGALIFLQKLRISPDAGYSVNDWTALVIFMVVIGGLGSFEGPIIGALIFFVLRETLSQLGPLYLIVLGAVAIAVAWSRLKVSA